MFQLYMCGRTQHVRLGLTKSSIVRLLCGVPQGSVLGLILFVLYTAALVRLIEQHVKVSYRAPRFVLDLTWSILRPKF